MARGYVINGPTLVTVQNAALGANELGLANGPITVSPTFYHEDWYADDFGDRVPPETLWMGSDAAIEMVLVHYDHALLLRCLNEAMAGSTNGTFAGIGTPMGGGMQAGSVGNHYIQMALTSPTLQSPWTFPTAYLSQRPMILPLGVERTQAQLVWRAIAYRPPSNPTSAGAQLWY